MSTDAPRYFGSHVVIDLVGFSMSNKFYPFWETTKSGFKINTSNAQLNNDNTPAFYMAFAEAPLVGSNNIAATAR